MEETVVKELLDRATALRKVAEKHDSLAKTARALIRKVILRLMDLRQIRQRETVIRDKRPHEQGRLPQESS